jgi:hypothetical protein
VHEHGTARTVIGTETRTIRYPMRLGLGDLVCAYLTMHSIHMGYEQRAVCVVTTQVYMQVVHVV